MRPGLVKAEDTFANHRSEVKNVIHSYAPPRACIVEKTDTPDGAKLSSIFRNNLTLGYIYPWYPPPSQRRYGHEEGVASGPPAGFPSGPGTNGIYYRGSK